MKAGKFRGRALIDKGVTISMSFLGTPPQVSDLVNLVLEYYHEKNVQVDVYTKKLQFSLEYRYVWKQDFVLHFHSAVGRDAIAIQIYQFLIQSSLLLPS